MAIQLHGQVRDAMMNVIEALGANSTAFPKLSIWSLGIPANCAAANTSNTSGGTPVKLVEISIPAQDWLTAASSGAISMVGTWQDTSADAAGTATWFRIHSALGGATANCLIQGTVGEGSGDMSLDNTDIAAGQQVTVTSFSLTAGNA
jgi:hypothetical protein